MAERGRECARADVNGRTQNEQLNAEIIMRYLCVYKSERESSAPPTQEEIMKMGQLIGEMTQQGVLLATDGCKPSAFGARVTIDGGKYTVTDGPFTEAKEFIGGLAIIKVNSKPEAIEWTKRFLSVVGSGTAEVLEINEAPVPH
jgi:hypothetical protein